MGKKIKTTRRHYSNAEDFMHMARIQMKRCCIPTAVSITASVVLSKIGAPIVPLALIGAGGYAWIKGYRIRIAKANKTYNKGEKHATDY